MGGDWGWQAMWVFLVGGVYLYGYDWGFCYYTCIFILSQGFCSSWAKLWHDPHASVQGPREVRS